LINAVGYSFSYKAFKNETLMYHELDAITVKAGLKTLKDDEKIENDYIISKTKKELYEEGKLSKEEYNHFIDEVRQSEYAREADPLGLQVLRGDVEKSVWLEKIEEIKKRYPKIK